MADTKIYKDAEGKVYDKNTSTQIGQEGEKAGKFEKSFESGDTGAKRKVAGEEGAPDQSLEKYQGLAGRARWNEDMRKWRERKQSAQKGALKP